MPVPHFPLPHFQSPRFVVFDVMLRLLVINISSSSPTINKVRRLYYQRYLSQLATVWRRRPGASPTYPPHFCQRSFLRLMQIRRVFTEGGSQSGCQRVQNTKRFYNDSESAITHRCCLSVLRVCVCRQTAYTNTIFSKTKQLRVYGLY